MENKSEKVEASWNIAQGFIFEIQGALQSATYYFQKDNIYQAFKCLESAKMRIIQYLSSEERKEFVDIETPLRTSIARINRIHEPDDCPKTYNKLNREIHNNYEKYNNLLMDILKKYKLAIPDKELDEGMF